MNYCVYNKSNWCETIHQYFPTYFRTRKAAIAYARTIDRDGLTIERKIGGEWFKIPFSLD